MQPHLFSISHDYSVINMTCDLNSDRTSIKNITIAKGDKRRANAAGIVIAEQNLTLPYAAFVDIAREIMRINRELKENVGNENSSDTSTAAQAETNQQLRA